MTRTLSRLILLWFAGSTAAVSGLPLPVGGEFQVNTYTTDWQHLPAVAAAADGAFVVVWESLGSSGSDDFSESIQLRRFDAVGDPLGGDFQVNTYGTSIQAAPAVAAAAGGEFVVVWESIGSSGSDDSIESIQLRRFDAVGDPLGDDFQVNSYTPYSQRAAAVATAADGAFVVVWESAGSSGSDNSSESIQLRRFDAVGDPLGDDVQVNTYTTGGQSSPAVAVAADGAFVVAWQSTGSSGSDDHFTSIQLRRFDSSGAPLGDDFQVNTYTYLRQRAPAVAVTADGGFVVVWEGYGSDGPDNSDRSIQLRRFDSSGAPLGDDFQVNTYGTDSQRSPAVAVAAEDDFVVVWQSDGSSGSDNDRTSIQLRAFDAGGSPFGDDFQVNTYTTWWQGSPAVAVDPDGDFAVAWQSFGSSGTYASYYSIAGRRFSLAGVFADGFESGDTSAWTHTVP